MRHGFLSEYFEGVVAKRLSAVEANVLRSHQHEFDGVEGLRSILGEPQEKIRYEARFIYFTDSDDEPVTDEGFLTWYDARRRARLSRGVMRWEYRLYFPTNLVSQCAVEGDSVFIAKLPGTRLLAVVAEAGSTIESQLQWLFGLGALGHPGFSVKTEVEMDQDRIGYAARAIIETLGIAIEEQDANFLDDMLARFGGGFPNAKDFSNYARSTLANDIDALATPDIALLAYVDREEILFRTLERYLLATELQSLADGPVVSDAYGSLADSYVQRRRSRAECSLENHAEYLFTAHQIQFSRGAFTEYSFQPSFLFPGVEQYHDSSYPETRLTMLASKTTCKDRWRQTLSEAERIPHKHLLTLEPSISVSQTIEMEGEGVSLVVPSPLHDTFTSHQKTWLLNLLDFIELARFRQA